LAIRATIIQDRPLFHFSILRLMKYKRRAIGLRIIIPLHIGIGTGIAIGVAPDEPSSGGDS
jgi:hypothetical protein